MKKVEDLRDLRRGFGHFATGVTIVSYFDDTGAAYGLTVNSLTSVSLEPPLLLVSIDRKTKAFKKLLGQPFTVNVLHSQQSALAYHFAGKSQDVDVHWQEGVYVRAPRLEDALAYFECEPYETYDGGDHVLYLGLIKGYDYASTDMETLLFYQGKMLSLPVSDVLK
ncbi:MAG: flavin reductase [Candidatus Carbobacillus altaicus]|uniref:Nitrilotriacetate monooxygenase component B n=1 Tax=Candidatus Carbonibacillus altaicus TaxID=2163959 RepID=A0A2R6Y039_9BACL|nr:flavin reductase [Candidatus Carbobacillus altaicus]PTQ56056.1 MAG: Nitrilotriacetate monooxygenase component B [Candidatus Carbobacillus altaicus]